VAANLIWNKLARNQSFYGLRAAEHLRQAASNAAQTACSSQQSAAVKAAELDIAPLRHPLRSAPDSSTDVVSELLFLHVWDEAAFWLDRSDISIPKRAAAEISYLGGKYDRAISLADRLPRSEATLPLVYPVGYRKTICDAAQTFGTDALWLHAIIWQESKYNPTSRSGAAARGLMQFIPETANAVASTIGMSNLTLERLFDPSTSIQLGAAYWASLMEKFKSPELALAAYNGGPDNVQRWFDKSSDPELFVSDIGFVETKKYVMFVYAAHAAYMSLLN
jgi:soluble lytic murein transglycosylase-like protein